MLLTSQTLVAEPGGSIVWPHVIIAIISVSTMVSLLSLCVTTHCCRNAKKKENPYGEITATPTADVSVAAVVSRNRIDGSQFHHSSRLSYPSLSLHERSVNRLSAPLPHSSAVMKRALPKLPEHSAPFDNKNPGAAYSTVDRTTRTVGRNGSFLYGEGPTNPTYESIDMVPLYSKAGNGDSSVKRYDYPTFSSGNQPAIATDDVLYQSASQIYAGVSEDPYSSITSHTGGETSYDVGYSHVSESTSTEPPRHLANVQAESRTLDHLYSRIRRGPSTSAYRHLPSSELRTEYNSSGSDKTSREPSYRYITVRETVDAIRQRLNELNQSPNILQSVAIDGGGPVREHYYSSIGCSDYETLQVSATSTNQISYDNQDAPLASCSDHYAAHREMTSNAASICENMPPKPPTSPIPLRIVAVKEDNLPKKEESLSGINMDETLNDDGSCSNISEKIRRLRTNFFDQELKLLEQSLETVNQHETSKWIHSSGTNRNLDPEHYVDQSQSANYDDTYSHLPKSTNYGSNVYIAQNATRDVLPSSTSNEDVVDQEYCKIIVENSRSHSSHESGVCGTKEFTEEDPVFQLEGNNDEEQCFISKGLDILGKQADNSSSTFFVETSRGLCTGADFLPFRSSSFARTSSSPQQSPFNKTSRNTKDGTQFCFDQPNAVELCEESVQNEELNDEKVGIFSAVPTLPLISYSENILPFVSRTENKSAELPGIN